MDEVDKMEGEKQKMKPLMWFVKMVLTVMLVSSLTLLTTGLIVQSYAKSLLASFNIEWEGQPTGLMGMFHGALGDKQSSEGEKSGNTSTDEPAGTEEEKAPENSISVMGNGTSSGEAGNPESSGSGKTDEADTGKTSGTVNGDETGAGSGPEGGNAQTAAIRQEVMQLLFRQMILRELKTSQLTEEKERIFTPLMNKSPQKEMQEISGAMEGGLTEQELRDIEQVISKYLTSEEYDDLMEVLQAE